MLIRIEAHDLPGTSCGPSLDRPDDHHGIHAGVEAKNRPAELAWVGSTRGLDAVSWELEA